jgi:hypothetical protein
MTQQVEDIRILNIDEKPYVVDEMSDEVKNLVSVYNNWNRKEASIRDELLLVHSAKQELSRQIILQVRKEQADASAAVDDPETENTTPSTE